MRKTPDKTTQRIKELYALLATVAAQRAVDHVKIGSNPFGANLFVDATIEWLNKSSAHEVVWTYSRPRIG